MRGNKKKRASFSMKIGEGIMKRKVLFVGMFILVLAVTMLLSQQRQPAFSQDQEASVQWGKGAVLTGFWHWQINMDLFFPGAVLPSLVTFHNDGTGGCSDSVAFGGTPTNVYRYTPFQGVWERIGPHKFALTFMALRFDTTKNNVLVGIARSRATISFSTDFDHLEGTMHMDFLPCPDNPYGFLMCPNPLLAAEGDWQPWNPGMPSDFNIKAARVSNVPYND
jgi:hypothetical protein